MDEEVKAAVEELVSASAGRMADIENNLSRLELRFNRPGGGGGHGARRDDAETKAFLNFCRTGAIETKAALITGNDPAAGYLAPAGFEAELARNLVQFSPIRSVARLTEMSTGELKLPRRTAGTTAYWTAEQGDRTESEPSYGFDNLLSCEMATFVDVGNSLLEDSAIDLEAELRNDLAEAFGFLEGRAFLLGVNPGQPEGILPQAITSIASGAAAAVTADGLRTALFSLPQRYRARATWAMNSTTAGSVAKLKTGDGDYLWQPGLAAGSPDNLLGLPVIECVDMPDEGAGLKPVLLGDFGAGYRIGDRIGLTVLRDPFSQATKGTTRFHARRRVAGVVRLVDAFRSIRCATS